MQNINQSRQSILETVNVGQIIENFEPLSLQGTELKKFFIESLNNQKLSSITALTDVVIGCNNLKNVDTNAYSVAESVSKLLENNIKAKIVYCHESTSSRNLNVITENFMKKLDELIVMEDVEIVNAIRSGVLNPYKSIQSVNLLMESVKIPVSENAVSTNAHNVFNPVSYVEINENGSAYVRLHNKVFAINGSVVVETSSPSSKFNYVSSIVEHMKWDAEKEQFTAVNSEFGVFNVTENAIERSIEDNVQVYESTKSFINEMSMIIESKQQSRQVNNTARKQFIDAVVTIKENFNNVSLIDNVVMIEHIDTKDKFALIIAENTAYISTLKSSRYPMITERFTDVRDALNVLKNKSGYDAKAFVTKELSVVENLDANKAEQVSGLNHVIEKLTEKGAEINTMINEEKLSMNANPERLSKLNDAKNLNNTLLIEQNNKLAEVLQS